MTNSTETSSKGAGIFILLVGIASLVFGVYQFIKVNAFMNKAKEATATVTNLQDELVTRTDEGKKVKEMNL
jgi:hypothetical protein